MRFIFSLTVIFSVALIAPAVGHNSLPTTGVQEISTNLLKNTEQNQSQEEPRITLADAKKDFDAGNVLFIDARGEDSYKAEHIKGAVNITEDKLKEKIKNIPKNKKIIAYCS